MTKARDLANLIAAGNPLDDGALGIDEVTGLTSSLAAKQAIVTGVSDTEIGYLDGVTSALQTQLNNISVTSGSLTKSFTNGETASITLGTAISPAPVVSVIKEVPQVGVSSKGAWDVNATSSNYELHNTAYATTLTTGATLALGTGSFASTDVGKRIVGNGGDVTLTSTAGAYSTTGGSAFTDGSTIASGSWSMRGLKSAGATDGIGFSGFATSGNYESVLDVTDGHAHKVTLGNTDAAGSQGFTIDPNGLYLFAVDSSTDHIRRYDFGTAWDLSTLNTTMTSGQQVNHNSIDAGPVDVAFNSSGTKMYVAGQNSDYVYQWNLTTAWDLSTASYNSDLNVQGSSRVNGGFNGLFVKPDGTSLYTVCRNTDRVAKWNMTGENISTGTIDGVYNVDGQNTYPFDVAWSPDGSAMYVSGNNNGFYKYNATTPFSLSGISHDSSFSVTINTNASESFFIKPDETRMYTMYNNEISQWNIGSLISPTSQYNIGVTNSGGQIDTEFWNDINSMTADQTAGDGTVHYAVSTDDRTTWSVAKASDGVRPIVRDNSGTWQYNSDATYGSTTWANSTTNDEFYALQQALGATSVNRMDKTQLDAVADGSHFTLGDTLDLAIALRQDTASASTPTSDGVSINYDAQALNQGAVLGTDYDYDFPDSTTVRVTSNAAQNLKVRVV